MNSEITRILDSLPGHVNVTDVYDEIERRVAAGDPDFAHDLALAIVGLGFTETEPWQYETVFSYALRTLAITPGRANIERTVRLPGTRFPKAERRAARFWASVLASEQPVGDLLAAVFAPGKTAAAAPYEMRACLLHELVLRGVDVSGHPETQAFAAALRSGNHPLAALPTRLLENEENVGLPRYSARGASHGLPFHSGAELPHPSARTPPGPSRAFGLAEIGDRAQTEAIATAANDWQEHSNGKVEARVFASDVPLDRADLRGVIDALPLECLAGARHGTVRMSASTAEGAWRMLFSVASRGGAYSRSRYGAYGRLAAWHSMTGLVGAPVGTEFEQIDASARTCTGYDLGTETDWFYDVAWDFGILALRPDQHHVAVLAATDTD
ncbi:DUF6183 family protein [Streptomyces sp. NPDC050610]|uniref:DUF6183 family protein n=1 Tax=Streptomyces sp. NPDC050610 TaxID=3157097 RepID=UPI003433DCCC